MNKGTYKKAGSLLRDIDKVDEMRKDIQWYLRERFEAKQFSHNGTHTYSSIDESRGLSQSTFDELERIILKDLDSKLVKLQEELAKL